MVVERAGVAAAASGKSGGFLALDWCDGTPLQRLARRSFALHARLAEEITAEWGFRRLTTLSGSARTQSPMHDSGVTHEQLWLSPDVKVDRHLGSVTTTAQVHP